MRSFNALVLPSLVYLFSAAATDTSAKDNDASEARDNLNGGYYLLHKLCSDEAQLPLLLVVKDTPKQIHDFADKVSRTAKESMAVLDQMQEKDPQINWDHNPLPKFERDVRESITAEKQHQLLFGATGSDFARALILSQTEASKYGANITKVLAEQEENPERAKSLRRLSEKWHALYDESFRFLRNY